MELRQFTPAEIWLHVSDAPSASLVLCSPGRDTISLLFRQNSIAKMLLELFSLQCLCTINLCVLQMLIRLLDLDAWVKAISSDSAEMGQPTDVTPQCEQGSQKCCYCNSSATPPNSVS